MDHSGFVHIDRALRFFRNWELGGFQVLIELTTDSISRRFSVPHTSESDDLKASAFNQNESTNGGKILLDSNAFAAPPNNALGNTSRNEFAGPGLYSLDVSLRRTFSLRERWRFTLRADAFNMLNHANLNNPSVVVGSPGLSLQLPGLNIRVPTLNNDFGVAPYGRTGTSTGFPGSSPLDETARQIQLSFRVDF